MLCCTCHVVCVVQYSQHSFKLCLCRIQRIDKLYIAARPTAETEKLSKSRVCIPEAEAIDGAGWVCSGARTG